MYGPFHYKRRWGVIIFLNWPLASSNQQYPCGIKSGPAAKVQTISMRALYVRNFATMAPQEEPFSWLRDHFN